jgi:hypothetical protein
MDQVRRGDVLRQPHAQSPKLKQESSTDERPVPLTVLKLPNRGQLSEISWSIIRARDCRRYGSRTVTHDFRSRRGEAPNERRRL